MRKITIEIELTDMQEALLKEDLPEYTVQRIIETTYDNIWECSLLNFKVIKDETI